MERNVTFTSGGKTLSGVLRLPDGATGAPRPAMIVLHGFGSNKNAGNVLNPIKMLSNLGYATLRFDMRGCGESEGERGRLICLEQVEDTRAAISFLCEQPEVDAARIGVAGSSFGAAVALYTGAVDDRVAAVVSSGGWGNGERKFRGQHSAPGAFETFENLLSKAKATHAKTGTWPVLDRYEIVPIPSNLRGHLVKGSLLEFSAETAISMFEFNAEELVHQISPRPLLLLHSSEDHVTPTEQSVELFQRAGQPCDLHLFAETDHFMFAEENMRVRKLVTEWLEKFFPVNQDATVKDVSHV